MNRLSVYLFFFMFVVAYSTFTVFYTTYGFIEAGTYDISTFAIRIFALAMIYAMFAMFLDTLKRKRLVA